MKKFLIAAAMIVASTAAHADTLIYKAAGIELEMKKGDVTNDGGRAEQLITITNHSTVAIRYLTVECGFFHDDLLIGTGMDMPTGIEPNQNVYVKIASWVLSANRTDCRFSGVKSQ